LDELLDQVPASGLDVSRLTLLCESIKEGFSTDLANPPSWVVAGEPLPGAM
jgi:hypothetical protein